MLDLPRQRLAKNTILVMLLIYVTLCVVFGGASRYNLYIHAVLQSIAALGIAFLIFTWPAKISISRVAVPIGLLCTMEIYSALQVIPLPTAIWKQLPGREFVILGFDALEVRYHPMPISLDTEASIANLGYALTPLFVILAAIRVGIRRLKRVLPVFMCMVGFCSAALGMTQIYFSRENCFYFYENTNYGLPVGTFANVNHFASMLLMLLPFGIYKLREKIGRSKRSDENIANAAIFFILLLGITLGIVAAGSLAVYLMCAPVIALSFMGAGSNAARTNEIRSSLLLFCAIFILGIFLVSTNPNLENLGITGAADDPTSRQNMWSYTLAAIGEFWPVGSGTGTYENVIPLFEDPNNVNSRFIALAHNEYLQILMEFGLVGLVVMLVSIAWAVLRIKSIWLCGEMTNTLSIQKMASIGIVVCVVHSVVDYPARTPAITSLVGILISLLALTCDVRNRSTNSPTNPSKRIVL